MMECQFCGAKAPIWNIRVYRREDQARPDFSLTICGKCLPRVNEFLEESDKSDKSDAWTSDTWNK